MLGKAMMHWENEQDITCVFHSLKMSLTVKKNNEEETATKERRPCHLSCQKQLCTYSMPTMKVK